MPWVKTADDAGPMSNVLASHSLNGDAMRAHAALYRVVMFGESGLSRGEREALSVAVSAANGCSYCRIHHSAAVTRETGDQHLAEAIACGHTDDLEPRVGALVAYAMKLTIDPAAMVPDDLEPLRAAGLTDRDIVDANQVVAYFNYVNRVASGLGVELESVWGTDAMDGLLISSATE